MDLHDCAMLQMGAAHLFTRFAHRKGHKMNSKPSLAAVLRTASVAVIQRWQQLEEDIRSRRHAARAALQELRHVARAKGKKEDKNAS